MTPNFIAACAIICCALYLPGFIVLKSVRLSVWHSLAFAPLFSIVLYCFAGVLYDKCGIFSTGWNILAFALLFAIACCVVVSLFVLLARKRHPSRFAPAEYAGSAFDRLIPFAYLIFGFMIGDIMFVQSFPSTDNAASTWDNVFHFNLLHEFIELGSWSTLDANSAYLDMEGAYPAPFKIAHSFYPAGWHIIAALPISLIDTYPPIAGNATNFVFLVMVYPLGVWALLKEIFHNNKPLVTLGVLVGYAFQVCPWSLLAHWPLPPNYISFTMVPLLCAAFLCATRHAITWKKRFLFIFIFLVGAVAEVLCQPNAVFTVVALMAPYVVYRGSKKAAQHFAGEKGSRQYRKTALLSGFLIALAIFALWLLFFSLPFMQSTVDYHWSPIATAPEAILGVIDMSFTMGHPQEVLGAVTIIGIIYILVKKRDLSWLVASYAFTALIFILGASLWHEWIKQFLAGFWYTDMYRVMNFVGLAGVPLAIVGLYACCKFVAWALAKLKARRLHESYAQLSMRATYISNVVVVAVLCACFYNLQPIGTTNTTAFGNIKESIHAYASGHTGIPYDDAEHRFVKKVLEIVDEDDVVLNHPYDGSMIAYGINYLPTYYRSISGYGSYNETEIGELLRMNLSSIATNEEVQKAVREIGAEYVLLLEEDTERMQDHYRSYDEELWPGFQSINDDTPGFELILEGDEEHHMRLYKIVIP